MTPRRDDAGSVTVWVLGLCVVVFVLGGLSLDLWRVLAAHRELAAMADAAATAAANGLDEDALRGGELVLDPRRARALAAETLGASSGVGDVRRATVDVAPGRVEVHLEGVVPLTLLRLVGATPVEVTVRSAAEPWRTG